MYKHPARLIRQFSFPFAWFRPDREPDRAKLGSIGFSGLIDRRSDDLHRARTPRVFGAESALARRIARETMSRSGFATIIQFTSEPCAAVNGCRNNGVQVVMGSRRTRGNPFHLNPCPFPFFPFSFSLPSSPCFHSRSSPHFANSRKVYFRAQNDTVRRGMYSEVVFLALSDCKIPGYV